ncbi:hypothetical protein ARZXY2_4701 (plasmid) [Arthrobacter sp. ZXY-2]|nr:hypothetical protein ARZXY2_4701 [Arthrobacter sp. ZXY-2]
MRIHLQSLAGSILNDDTVYVQASGFVAFRATKGKLVFFRARQVIIRDKQHRIGLINRVGHRYIPHQTLDWFSLTTLNDEPNEKPMEIKTFVPLRRC